MLRKTTDLKDEYVANINTAINHQAKVTTFVVKLAVRCFCTFCLEQSVKSKPNQTGNVHKTNLSDGKQRTNSLQRAELQPVGDLDWLQKKLASPVVTVLTYHPTAEQKESDEIVANPSPSNQAQRWRNAPSHQPLLTLTDNMWLLKPSSNMLEISVSVVISRPSRHSRLNSEMEGTVNVCTEDRWKFRGHSGGQDSDSFVCLISHHCHSLD